MPKNWRGFDDGLLAGAKLAKILAETKSPFADVPRSIASPEIVKDIGNRNGREIVAQIAAAANFDGAQLCMLDGIRADYPDGFGLVRASNTTASLVLRFEGENRTALETHPRAVSDGTRSGGFAIVIRALCGGGQIADKV